MKLLILCYLGMNSWTDWRQKEIDLRTTVVFFLLITGIHWWKRLPLNWLGLLPGLCLWILAWYKKEKIGSGDGIVVMSLGWAMGIRQVWKILAGGFLLAGIAGVVLSVNGERQSTEIPFVPFILISFLMEGWTG